MNAAYGKEVVGVQDRTYPSSKGHPYPGFYFRSTMLKLVLQTQEGQQIEVTVSPEETFADLKRQYESPDNPDLAELLKQLITNGVEVDENTKVFDFVTNSSSTEWLVEESLDDITALDTVDGLQTIIEEMPLKECCVKDCSNTEITTPEKVFFPLPNDKDRLSSWLTGIDQQDLINLDVESDSEIEAIKYFVCADHFSPQSFLKGTNQVLKRRACPSLVPSAVEERATPMDSMFIKTELIEEALTPLTQLVEKDKNQNVSETMQSGPMLELLDVSNETTHPGVLCRLCGEHTITPVYLFSGDNFSDEFSVADKINLCLPITVNVKDPLPKQVCEGCFEKLEMCHNLAKTCLETEDKLRTMFEMKEFSVENAQDKQCPLCVCGNMQIVTKSGIYRKDKTERIPECLKNSSARTRQVSPSRNSHNKITTWSSMDKEAPLQESEFNDDISSKIDEQISKEDEIPLNSPLYVSQGDLSCSICCRKENNVKSLAQHAKEHDGYSCTICQDVNFKTINEQQLHFLKHGVNDDYCEICSTELSNGDNAEEHIKLCNPEFWYLECARCGKKFPNLEAGNSHDCKLSEKEDWFECDQCGKKFSQKSSLNSHMKSHEKRETGFYKCLFCKKEFTRKGSLLKHISALHADAEAALVPKCYKCKKCDEAFSTLSNAESHITEKHFSQLIMGEMNFISDQFTAEEISVTRVYICEYCERCYTIPSSLHDHRQNEHCDNSDYHCNVCNNSFETYKSLLRHKTLHVKENQLEDLGIKQYYLCNYCNKTFLHYGTLTVHTSQHQEPLPYLCRICNTQFATYKEVAEHRKTIHPYQSGLHEKPTNSFNCHYCEKNFTYEVGLIKHIRMHTGERPYKCTVCGKGFTQSSGLYTHLKVHSDLRPYTCPQCPQTFKIKGDRDNHVKKHSGNRPYKCEFCEKAFMTQHVFSQHRKIHTNERPYKCDICGEAFRRSHVLTVHMRRHTGEKPHVCDMCSKAYRQRGDLLKHKKIQHGVGANNSNGIVANSSSCSVVHSGDVSSTESTTVFLPI